jgi:hypothetical protein
LIAARPKAATTHAVQRRCHVRRSAIRQLVEIERSGSDGSRFGDRAPCARRSFARRAPRAAVIRAGLAVAIRARTSS